MSKTLSIEEVERILTSGNFESLKGAIEDEKLECKSEPYLLENDHHKLELAKDVSALANSGGGVVLIGAKTEKDPSHLGDEIKEIRPFAQSLIDTERYQNIVTDWIFPTLDNLVVKWWPLASDTGKGIVSILVREQPTSRSPFLITKSVDAKGRLNHILFGFAERRRATASPKSVEELHTLLRDGGIYHTINPKLDAIQEALGRINLKQTIPRPSPNDLLKARLDEVIVALDLGAKYPTYALVAYPLEEVEIPDLFLGRDAKTVELLEHPPRVRARGFDLDTREVSRNVAGERRQALSPKDRCLSLWKDGMLVFVADGINFLCWPSGGTDKPILRINSLALAESTLEFCELSKALFHDLSPKPRKISYLLHLRHMILNGNHCSLNPYPVTSTSWMFNQGTSSRGDKTAPDETNSFPVLWEGEINPGEVAFRLVSQVYEWFGLDHDRIPYTEGARGNLVISGEEIRRLNP